MFSPTNQRVLKFCLQSFWLYSFLKSIVAIVSELIFNIMLEAMSNPFLNSCLKSPLEVFSRSLFGIIGESRSEFCFGLIMGDLVRNFFWIHGWTQVESGLNRSVSSDPYLKLWSDWFRKTLFKRIVETMFKITADSGVEIFWEQKVWNHPWTHSWNPFWNHFRDHVLCFCLCAWLSSGPAVVPNAPFNNNERGESAPSRAMDCEFL